MQLVNRLFSTQTTHTQSQATCWVTSLPNPSLVHQAALLLLTSSILPAPVVSVEAHQTNTF